ncbi:HK97 family phage prohead protease [Methylobacterium durans]|uniref:HK97 family phage prohead protease n=1 Tax=Methylobacterium durans TaxID=2202825 RepID=UPI002B002CC7|nr:HK97 family phage prohead protease [Methylobacterium durans]MEA1831734.1 HK97 family phage prohead protease [Methylobacterium durans]
MKIEIAAGISLDTKAVSDDGTFEGYASVFHHRDSHSDIVEPGAFTKSLAERPAPKIKMLRQHRQDEPIGVWIDAAEDSKGLHVRGRLIREVPLAAQTYALMKEGALDQLSIGFRTKRDRFDRKTAVRHIEEADLREISIVTFGSNDKAAISAVKSIHDPERAHRIVAALNRAAAALRS